MTKRGRKINEKLRKSVEEYRKKGLSLNEIARILHTTPQYIHYLTKPLSTGGNNKSLDWEIKY